MSNLIAYTIIIARVAFFAYVELVRILGTAILAILGRLSEAPKINSVSEQPVQSESVSTGLTDTKHITAWIYHDSDGYILTDTEYDELTAVVR